MSLAELSTLREIREAIDRKPRIPYEAQDLREFAIKRLAHLNGWNAGPHIRCFRPEDIGKRSGEFHNSHDVIWDHVVYFRAGGKCAAILTEPYDHVTMEDFALAEKLDGLANACGVAWHIPPHRAASTWFPGYTISIVFTASGHVMRWLPEQLTGIPGLEPRWAKEKGN
ncbi:MAG: hypothetical protein WBF73_26740 [Bradyrhizobium sp.]